MMSTKSSSKFLIIGKNSNIVKSICTRLHQFDFISHNEVDGLDIIHYEKIYIFSWDFGSKTNNFSLLSHFDLKKVVFISTIAVLACAKRTQWALYPNAKLACENLVLDGGGQIIRIGIWEQSFLKDLPGLVPITTKELLISSINECIISTQRVFWPISLKPGSLNGFKLTLNKIFAFLSDNLPDSFLFQIPIAFICRLLKLKDYGYTHDCLGFFTNRVLVGYGALGSEISKQFNKLRFPHAIVVSSDQNLLFRNDGFKGFRIGQFKAGLAGLWHGVRIDKTDDMHYVKRVPLFVRRPRIPSRAIIGSVKQIKFFDEFLTLDINNTSIRECKIFARVAHLAAGVINNVRILQSTHRINTEFSDHEIGCIGTVSTDELCSAGFLSRKLGLVFGRRIIRGCTQEGFEYMIDFRPSAPTTMGIDAENIYNNRLSRIIYKLSKTMSMKLVNQAIFNKFGIAFYTHSFQTFIQIEAKNCIKLNNDGTMVRHRLPQCILAGTSLTLESQFRSFRPCNQYVTFDGIHAYGGFNIDDYPDLMANVMRKKLYLHGNVFDDSSLGPFHNTSLMIKRELERISESICDSAGTFGSL